MWLVKDMYRLPVTWLVVVISYLAHIWININKHQGYVPAKYMAYKYNLEGIFVSGTIMS